MVEGREVERMYSKVERMYRMHVHTCIHTARIAAQHASCIGARLCMRVRACVCVHACACMRVRACVCVHACACMRVRACVCVHACACVYVYVCVCVCVCGQPEEREVVRAQMRDGHDFFLG